LISLKKKRIISRFDIKGPNLVKGINLEGLRVICKPEFFADLYYKDNIDEKNNPINYLDDLLENL
jgi:cyclase